MEYFFPERIYGKRQKQEQGRQNDNAVNGNQGRRPEMTPDEIKAFIGNHIRLAVDDDDLDYDSAHDLAKEKAKELTDDPMLLSWYCGRTGEYYPKTECGRMDKPAWIVFAESRGADIAININDGEYIFLYLTV